MTFQDILQQYGIPSAGQDHPHYRAGWLNIDCFNCGLSRHFRLGYSLQGKYANCWACGPIPLIKVLHEITQQNWEHCRGLLQALGPRVATVTKRGRYKPPKGVGQLLQAHEAYLLGRGLDPAAMERLWHLAGIGIHSTLSWRIFIPVHYRGDVVSWTTRHIRDTVSRRYWSAGAEDESIPAKELLFGEDYARTSIIICEGPMDVFKIGPGAVCTLGTSYTQAQVEKMSRYSRRAICFDNEPTAQARARKLLNSLSAFAGETLNVTLDAKDPGSAGPEELAGLRELLEV